MKCFTSPSERSWRASERQLNLQEHEIKRACNDSRSRIANVYRLHFRITTDREYRSGQQMTPCETEGRDPSHISAVMNILRRPLLALIIINSHPLSHSGPLTFQGSISGLLERFVNLFVQKHYRFHLLIYYP